MELGECCVFKAKTS